MAASIKVFKYPYGPDEDKILTKLQDFKKIDLNRSKIISRQSNNLDSLIIQNIEEFSGIITGLTILWKREKIHRYTEEQTDVPYHYNFTISRSKKVLILQGSSGPERNTIKKLLSSIIHDGVDSGYFLSFSIPKTKMIRLQKKILSLNKHNSVEDPRFDTTTNRYRNRIKQGFEVDVNVCATDDKEYSKILESCDNTNPVIRIVRCTGLTYDDLIEPKPLKINARGEFSFYTTISPQQWNEFFFDLCQPVLGTVTN